VWLLAVDRRAPGSRNDSFGVPSSGHLGDQIVEITTAGTRASCHIASTAHRD
jgi:hypothetical protein